MTTYDSYKGVPLDKLAEDVKWWEYCNGGCAMSLSNRLLEIHEKTRWISVEERLPTREDADVNRYVLVSAIKITTGDRINDTWLWSEVSLDGGIAYKPTHWKRIDKPEGV